MNRSPAPRHRPFWPTRTCPRCGARVPLGQRLCPRCGLAQSPPGGLYLLLVLGVLLGIICGGLALGTAPGSPPGTPFPGARTIVIPARATPTPPP